MSDNNKLKPGWKIWRFEQMATNVNVRIENPSESGMEHYVGLEHLDADSLKIRRWGTPDDVEATKLMFKKGDIIFGRRRAYQRKLGVAEFDGICSAHAMVLRAKPDVVLPEFLPFFMQSDLFMSRAVEISVGSLSPTINWRAMAVQEFALPPIETQKLILSVLSSYSALDDEYASANDSAANLLNAHANDIFSNRKYDLVPFEKVLNRQPQSGIYKAQDFLGRGTKIVNMGELFGFDMIDDSIEMKRMELTREEVSKYQLTSNDLIFGRRSIVLEGAGKCSMVGHIGEPVIFESSILRVTVDPKIVLPQFIFEWLRSPKGAQQINRIRSFTTVAGIAGSDLKRIVVPVMPIKEQLAISDELSSIRSSLGVLAARQMANRSLKKYILEKMMRGCDVQ